MFINKEFKNVSIFSDENPNPVLMASKEGKIFYANSAGLSLLNFWDCRIKQILPEPWLKLVNNSLSSGLTITYEGKFGPHMYFFSFAPITGKGRVAIYGVDITQRKRIEQELLQSKKLQAMDVMTKGIAHEFNNIFAIINGKIQILMRENKDREKLLDELRFIRKSVRNGAEIVRRMHKFANRSEDYGLYVTVDLGEEIKNAIDLTRPEWNDRAKKEGISYTIDSAGVKYALRIKGNPSELREVLKNIIHNAIDAMPEGGTLSFSTREKNGRVVLEISDTGAGMDEDTKLRIFDPFFTTRDKGVGLGMSIVFGILKRHGGKIEVQSQKGRGSAFTISFPAAKESMDILASAPEQCKAGSEKKGRKNRILIVDDEEAIGNVLYEFLSEEGYKVVFINNGAAALELLKKDEFDLVLCDLGMPDVSGWDILNVIDTMAKKPKVGIITGFLNTSDVFPGRELESDFVINKPFELEDVLCSVNNSLKD